MLRFKRGDSVIWPAHYKVDNTSVDLTDYDIASQVRTRDGRLIVAFTVVKANQATHPGDYTLSLTPEVSSAAPPGAYVHDIQYSLGGVVQSTGTVPCIIDSDQTR